MKKNTILYLVTVLVLAGVIGGILLFHSHQDSLLTFDTDPDVDIAAYLPFQDTEASYYYNVWRLNFWEDYHPLDVAITGDFPVLNGSDYFFPIYSGIVNALYPQTTRLGDDCFRLTTSAEAFRSLVDSETDIFFGYKPSAEMQAYAESKGVELELTLIGYEYPEFIVNSGNPAYDTLSKEQILDIFTGKITNWREVGGADLPILVYYNTPGSDAHWALELIMDGRPLAEPKTELQFTWDRGIYTENAQYRNLINAIGFYPAGNSVPKENIYTVNIPYMYDEAADRYYAPWTLPVYAITRADNRKPNVETVLEWITGPCGQYMVKFCGFDNAYYDSRDNDTAPVIDTAPSIRVQEYMPFREDTKIVKLEHMASLRLTDNLPRIDGAAAVFPVYSAFVHAVYPESTRFYDNDWRDHEELPGYFFFNYSNTVKGYQYLAQKNTDIFFGGYPSDKQIAYAEENGTAFVYTPIGYDAFVFFVHKDNPIDSLTSDQVRMIYSGAITNWKQVGGQDVEIVAYQRNEGSGSQSRLIRFMGDTPLMEPKMDTRIDDMIGITSKVAQFRSSTASIGFSFRYYMEALVANPDLKLLAIDGIAPTAENIANGTYPLTGYLYAVTWEGNENENVQKLLDWVLSPEGQYIIEKTGYVPVGPTE